MGIVVNSSGTSYNEIQRNTFRNVHVGIESIGYNRGTASGSGLHIG